MLRASLVVIARSPSIAHDRAKDFALKSLRTTWKCSVMMKMSLRRLLLLINHGFMVTILKLNNNLHSGSVQTNHGRKKHVKVGAMSSQCCLFFSIVHYEFASRGQTINKEYYVEVLKRLRDAVRRKRPRFWSSGDWLLHHDNAPAHSSNLVQQFLAKHKIVQLCQPPYSPDIAPCDF